MPDCRHLDAIKPDAEPSGPGCLECTALGGRWVHLRRCATCGHVGCCDSSPNRHATAHNAETGHPVVQTYEPGEDWWWCYVDDVFLEVEDFPHHWRHP